jgi:hypothetical protein
VQPHLGADTVSRLVTRHLGAPASGQFALTVTIPNVVGYRRSAMGDVFGCRPSLRSGAIG